MDGAGEGEDTEEPPPAAPTPFPASLAPALFISTPAPIPQNPVQPDDLPAIQQQAPLARPKAQQPVPTPTLHALQNDAWLMQPPPTQEQMLEDELDDLINSIDIPTPAVAVGGRTPEPKNKLKIKEKLKINVNPDHPEQVNFDPDRNLRLRMLLDWKENPKVGFLTRGNTDPLSQQIFGYSGNRIRIQRNKTEWGTKEWLHYQKGWAKRKWKEYLKKHPDANVNLYDWYWVNDEGVRVLNNSDDDEPFAVISLPPAAVVPPSTNQQSKIVIPSSVPGAPPRIYTAPL